MTLSGPIAGVANNSYYHSGTGHPPQVENVICFSSISLNVELYQGYVESQRVINSVGCQYSKNQVILDPKIRVIPIDALAQGGIVRIMREGLGAVI
jgi:hypothetical protein